MTAHPRAMGVAIALTVLPVAGVAQAPPATATGCAGVRVVVDYGRAGGISTSCAPGDPTSGLSALRGSGHRYTFVPRQPGFVCTIDARPNPCNNAPATAYWSYWHARPGGSWTYSSSSAGGYNPRPGSVEGWAFGSGRPPRARPPAAVAPRAKASTPAATPTAPARATSSTLTQPTTRSSTSTRRPAAAAEASPPARSTSARSTSARSTSAPSTADRGPSAGATSARPATARKAAARATPGRSEARKAPPAPLTPSTSAAPRPSATGTGKSRPSASDAPVADTSTAPSPTSALPRPAETPADLQNTVSAQPQNGLRGLAVGAALVSGLGIAAATAAWRRRRL